MAPKKWPKKCGSKKERRDKRKGVSDPRNTARLRRNVARKERQLGMALSDSEATMEMNVWGLIETGGTGASASTATAAAALQGKEEGGAANRGAKGSASKGHSEASSGASSEYGSEEEEVLTKKRKATEGTDEGPIEQKWEGCNRGEASTTERVETNEGDAKTRSVAPDTA